MLGVWTTSTQLCCAFLTYSYWITHKSLKFSDLLLGRVEFVNRQNPNYEASLHTSECLSLYVPWSVGQSLIKHSYWPRTFYKMRIVILLKQTWTYSKVLLSPVSTQLFCYMDPMNNEILPKTSVSKMVWIATLVLVPSLMTISTVHFMTEGCSLGSLAHWNPPIPLKLGNI